MPKNSHKEQFIKTVRIVWPFLIAILTLIFIKIAGRNPELTDKFYSKGVYPLIADIFSFFSRIVPFSLWDIFWLLIILSVLTGIILVLFRKIKFSWYILKIFQTAAFLYTFFYLSWGFNYFRPGIEQRLNWITPARDEVIFRTFLDTIISGSNCNYITLSRSDYKVIDSLVEKSYSVNRSKLGITYPNGRRRPKTMVFSSFFAKSGVSGYFGPFFNEIHLNDYLLPMDFPYVLAHEKAHQFGMTSEAEANLAAFIICVNSDDKRLRYSGYQSLLVYFLNDASELKDYMEIFHKLDKRVITDLRTRKVYYHGLQNQKLSDMQETANDIYLKANKIKSGVMNYNQVVSLAISWYSNAGK